MNTIEEDVERVLALRGTDAIVFNMCEEGGAMCYLSEGSYILEEVPQYGGVPISRGTYLKGQERELVEMAHSWT